MLLAEDKRGRSRLKSALLFAENKNENVVDAAYCYRLSSVVCQSVCRCVT